MGMGGSSRKNCHHLLRLFITLWICLCLHFLHLFLLGFHLSFQLVSADLWLDFKLGGFLHWLKCRWTWHRRGNTWQVPKKGDPAVKTHLPSWGCLAPEVIPAHPITYGTSVGVPWGFLTRPKQRRGDDELPISSDMVLMICCLFSIFLYIFILGEITLMPHDTTTPI